MKIRLATLVFSVFLIPLIYLTMNIPANTAEGSNRSRYVMQKMEHNILRYQSAIEYLRSASISPDIFSSGKDEMNNVTSQEKVGITIVTLQRNRKMNENFYPGYLPQVVSEFLRLVNTSSSKFKYRIYICNVDLYPEKYLDIRLLPHWLPKFTRFPNKSSAIWKTFYREASTGSGTHEKHKQDYAFCLNETFRQNVDSVLMMEDDALPLPDLFPVLTRITNGLFRHYSRKDFLFLKLYHPEHLLGYNSYGVERIPELISLCLLIAPFQILVYCKVFRKRYKPFLWVVCFLLNCLILLFIGRIAILELRRLSHHLYQVTYPSSCCLQAMFYTKEGAQALLDYLQKVRCYQGFSLDTSIDKLSEKTDLISKMVIPNLVQHIGHYSSIRSGFV